MSEETKMKIEEDFETDTLAYEIRGLLCNGTMDCENSPECPDGTDGCVALEIYKLHKAKIAQAEKDLIAEVLKATAKCKKYVEVVDLGTLTKKEVVEETVAISELLAKLEGK